MNGRDILICNGVNGGCLWCWCVNLKKIQEVQKWEVEHIGAR
jgi:hypothetical protein